MLSDAAAREAMGRRGYAMVRERFSWRAVAERHLAAYAEALGGAFHKDLKQAFAPNGPRS
jgi:glycosyltransferase involved in cell wall biosynthesis